MSKIITNFICPDCGVIDTLESWGSDLIKQDIIESTKNMISDFHKRAKSCYRILETNTTTFKTSLYLDKKVVYYDHQYREFVLGKIVKLKLIDNEKVYYAKDICVGNFKDILVDFDYNYIANYTAKEILDRFNGLAYIDDCGFLQYASIEEYFKILKGNKIITYISIYGNNFEMNDLIKLSIFLKEFDEYNVQGNKNISTINKKIDDYKKFRNYWVNKYYKVK